MDTSLKDLSQSKPPPKPPLTLVGAIQDIAIIIVLSAAVIGLVVVAHEVLPPIA